MKSKSYKVTRVMQLFWTFFIGFGAVWGSMNMLFDPSGKTLHMDGMLPYFQVLPFADVLFQNFIFSGISLLIVNGITQLITAVLLLKKHKLASRFSIGCGVILMFWITIQFCIFEFNWLSTSYFIFGAAETITGILMYRGEKKA